jgi:hypothetical protein
MAKQREKLVYSVMNAVFYAYVVIEGNSGNGRLRHVFPLLEDAGKWCEEQTAQFKGNVLDAYVNQFRPEPKDRVWEWKPKPH